jgi:hypothetical protein
MAMNTTPTATDIGRCRRVLRAAPPATGALYYLKFLKAFNATLYAHFHFMAIVDYRHFNYKELSSYDKMILILIWNIEIRLLVCN